MALFTIGGVLVLSVSHFGFRLKEPENLEAAKRVAADRESETTKVALETAQGRSLRERLDAALGINERLGTGGRLNPLDALSATC